MSFIGDSRTPQGSGILPLQHHFDPKTTKNIFPLHHRASLIATRILDRRMNDKGKDIGHWVIDEKAVGDLIGAFSWLLDKANPQTERRIPAWAFAYPTIIESMSGGMVTPRHPLFNIPGEIQFNEVNPRDNRNISQEFLPIREKSYDMDRRFKPIQIPFPRKGGIEGGKVLWNRHPIGTIGVGLASTEHNKQNELFLHADPRLIATNKAGIPDFSSWVYDTNAKNEYDDERRARLHNFIRVIKSKLFGIEDGILAWQMGLAGINKTPSYGSVYYDDGISKIIELTSQLMSGFYGAGSGNGDKHFINRTSDGEPITSGHLSTKAYFHRDSTRDAPLHFEEDSEKELDESFPYRVKSHIVYENELPHGFVLGTRKGKWKVQTEFPSYTAIPQRTRKPAKPPKIPESTEPIRARDPAGFERTAKPILTPRKRLVEEAHSPSRRDNLLEKSLNQLQSEPTKSTPLKQESISVAPQGKTYGVSTKEPSVAKQPNSVLYLPWDRSMGNQQHIITPQESAHTSLLWKPQKNFGRAIDLRASNTPSRLDVDDYTRSSPVVLRTESFGDNDGVAWNHTKENGLKSTRYPGGTAIGGIYFLPPELDLADAATGFLRPDLSISTGIVAYHPNVNQFMGILNTNPFSLESGFLTEIISHSPIYDYFISRYIAGVKALVFKIGSDKSITVYNDINMNSFNMISMRAPIANGEGIRQTAKITEPFLEDTYDAHQAADERSGFPRTRITDITPSFDDGTRTFTLTATGATYDYYIRNVKYTVTGSDNVVISDDEGKWFIYYIGDTLTASQARPAGWFTFTPSVMIIYWDKTNQTAIIQQFEMHANGMSGDTHRHFHQGFGSLYESGLDISGYTLNTDSNAGVTFGITDGEIHDEDTEINVVDDATPDTIWEQDLSDPGQIPVFSLSGATPVLRKNTITDYAFVNTAVGRVNWNELTGGSYQQTEATDNYFVAVFIASIPDINNPIIALQGQREDQKLADAQANNTVNNLDLSGNEFEEIAFLYRIIIRTKDTFGGDRKAKIMEVLDIRGTSTPAGTPLPSTAHARQHALNNATDHTSTIVENNIMTADANGLPKDSSIPIGNVIKSGDAAGGDLNGTYPNPLLDSDIKIKGWINFDGVTPAISDSFNVSSLVDFGTGNYGVAWDTDFATANYPAVGWSKAKQCLTSGTGLRAIDTGFQTENDTGTRVDVDTNCLIAMGDQ